MTITEQFTEILVEFPRRTILSDSKGNYSAEHIYNATQFILAEELNGKSFSGKRIAVFCRPGIGYVSSMLAGWMSGAMMVPMCVTHPEGELQHILDDARPEIILADKELVKLIPKSAAKIIAPNFAAAIKTPTPANYTNPLPEDPALMLYTSGTTGKPKGVVHTHASLVAQIRCLVSAWRWEESDRILHFLPLHHTHGIINKWLCALWVGARCDMMEKFVAEEVWSRLGKENYTVFMAIPTIYVKLIEESILCKEQQIDFGTFRLMVSGSAALPVRILEKWRVISGHTLLERYGMTETGMVLSNPYDGERHAGAVGNVLSGMQVRVVNEMDEEVFEEGELLVKGANLFSGYWNNDIETKKSFTKDGWFRTGDVVRVEQERYYIVGRISTDIIKSGGYKISALEIEEKVLEHSGVRECAVCGIPDETWGERVGVAIVWRGEPIDLAALQVWLKDKLAVYKLPSLMANVSELPRNAMGKVLKQDVKSLF